MKTFDFTAANGVPFRAVLVENALSISEPTVRFYDTSVSTREGGQFVADYYVSTLLGDRRGLARVGLSLHGGVPAWSIDGPSMARVLEWLAPSTGTAAREHREELATRLENAARDLSDLLSYWVANDLDSDILSGEEYPFDQALEDVVARVHASVHAIRSNDES